MPEISDPIVFNSGEKIIISAKLNDKKFNFTDWSDPTLLNLRIAIRRHYRNVQKGICSYCKKDVSLQSASNSHVEHIVPKSKELKFIFTPKNLCVVCADCNEIKREMETLSQEENPIKRKKKYTLYPRKSGSFKIFHPHFDLYDQHIFKCGDIYFDLSPKGSFTIMACRLNRKIHKFGMEPMLLSESQLLDLMSAYATETNFTKRQIVFNRLREYFIKL
ncbi:MAG: hypothetical protein ACI8ZM_003377 [Crocinitomix sp.]|jgi:hypothetical protein